MSFQFSELFGLSVFKKVSDMFCGNTQQSDVREEFEIQVDGRPVRVLSDEQYKEYLKNRGKPQPEKVSDPEQDKRLLNACYHGDMEKFHLALSNGADVNCHGYSRFYSQIRPLHLVAQNGNFEMVKILVEKGAEIDVLRTSNTDDLPCYDTPIDLAERAGFSDISSYLKKAHKANQKASKRSWFNIGRGSR